jgi:putative tricarboxylic transport membrane protein
MDISSILSNIGVLFTDPMLILLLVAGVFLGMYVGAIPGLSATMAVSLLISFTYSWDVLPALALMMGVHVGGCYGGSRSAILINIPGAPSAIATAFDGYPLSKQGKAAQAISITVVQSVVGGLIGCVFLTFATPLVAKVALQFAPRDYFLLAAMGLTLIASLGGGSFVKNIFCGALGLFIGAIGMDATDGMQRFSFGVPYLMSGVSYIVAMIGLFGFSEALIQIRDVQFAASVKQKVDKIRPHMSDVIHYFPLTIQTSLMGIFIGALPGTGGDIAALFAYDHAKRVTKNPKVPFGQGAVEGLVAPESANNAAVPAAYIPMLAFGVPGDSYAAVVIGALYVHGLNPGPMMMIENPGVVGIIVGGLIVANIALLFVGMSGIKMFAKIVEIPRSILIPIIMVLCVVGSYAINNNIVDVFLMAGFGIIGYFLRRHDFPTGALVLGIILSRMFELNLRRDLTLSQNSFGLFLRDMFTSPISLILIAVIVMMCVVQTPAWRKHRETKKTAREAAGEAASASEKRE